MIRSARSLLVLTGLSLLGIITHLVPHDMGVSTVGAISMLAAAFLPRSLRLVPVLATVLLVDAVNGFYVALAMAFVYLGHLAGVLVLGPILASKNARMVALAAIANALVFYLVSNITPMAMGFYPATLEGWINCYVNGLPFLLRGVLANLVFGGVAFGSVWLVGEIRAHRLVTTQRH